MKRKIKFVRESVFILLKLIVFPDLILHIKLIHGVREG